MSRMKQRIFNKISWALGAPGPSPCSPLLFLLIPWRYNICHCFIKSHGAPYYLWACYLLEIVFLRGKKGRDEVYYREVLARKFVAFQRPQIPAPIWTEWVQSLGVKAWPEVLFPGWDCPRAPWYLYCFLRSNLCLSSLKKQKQKTIFIQSNINTSLNTVSC